MRKTKKFWKSKTFWTNVVFAAGIALQVKTGFVIDPATQALVLTAVNTALRAVTKDPVVW